MENQITAIIVDDEEKARDVLAILLERNCPEINIVAKCNDLPSAVQQINKLSPDVVFLDIQMPQYAGFEIVNFIPNINFDIIFVTAFDEFALKAFELSALDYLLKPIDRNRLKQCVTKLLEKQEKSKQLQNYKTLLHNMKNEQDAKLVVSDTNGKRIIALNDICAIKGERAYSQIHLTNNEKILASKNLKHFEQQLKTYPHFYRSHKSWIINLHKVNRVQNSSNKVMLTNKTEAKISASKIHELQEKFSHS